MRPAWKAWCDFCDRAKVAPDTLLPAKELARRFNEQTGNMTTPEWVRKLLAEAAAEARQKNPPTPLKGERPATREDYDPPMDPPLGETVIED